MEPFLLLKRQERLCEGNVSLTPLKKNLFDKYFYNRYETTDIGIFMNLILLFQML